jgi:hypothetical protein
MEASDELLTIAELAIGLAGFSGVAVVFRGQGGLRLVDRFRFLAVLSQSLAVLILAFVPFGFHHAGQTGQALWMGSSAVMVVFWLLAAWILGFRFRPDFSVQDEQLPKSVEAAIWCIATLNLLLAVANLVGWPLRSGALFYLAALICWLMITGFLFATLVLYGASADKD